MGQTLGSCCNYFIVDEEGKVGSSFSQEKVKQKTKKIDEKTMKELENGLLKFKGVIDEHEKSMNLIDAEYKRNLVELKKNQNNLVLKKKVIELMKKKANKQKQISYLSSRYEEYDKMKNNVIEQNTMKDISDIVNDDMMQSAVGMVDYNDQKNLEINDFNKEVETSMLDYQDDNGNDENLEKELDEELHQYTQTTILSQLDTKVVKDTPHVQIDEKEDVDVIPPPNNEKFRSAINKAFNIFN